MKCRRIIACIVEIVIGLALTVLGTTGSVDEYWSGMGTALLVVGTLMLIRQIRYRVDKSYRENVDVAVSDERNRYLTMKAWSWAGSLFTIIAAFASIALKIAGMEEYVRIAGGSVCLIVLLYWVSWMILRRKY